MGGKTKKKKGSSQAAACCVKTLKIMFSHVGLCALVAAYAVAGGFIFQLLETENERQACFSAETSYVEVEQTTLNLLWSHATQVQGDQSNQDDIIAKIRANISSFASSVVGIGHNATTNCSQLGEPGQPELSWGFPGALLFSVTVITTIGYGNIAPKTNYGMYVCMAYATLGMPLMLICLANIGDILADAFRFVYSNVCCCGCCKIKPEKKPLDKAHWRTDATGKPIPPTEDDDDDDEDDDEDKLTVPLTITLMVIGAYISAGAVLFGYWEGWDGLSAAYFCFVTLTTMGFGDMVPGTNFEDPSAQVQLFFAALYLLFGMALLSMCFSLMQDEFVAKFTWIAEKFGLIKEDAEADQGEAIKGGEEDQGQRPLSSSSTVPRPTSKTESVA